MQTSSSSSRSSHNTSIPAGYPTVAFYNRQAEQQPQQGGGETDPIDLTLDEDETDYDEFIERSAWDNTAVSLRIKPRISGKNDWMAWTIYFLRRTKHYLLERLRRYGACKFWPEVCINYRNGKADEEFPAVLNQQGIVLINEGAINEVIERVRAGLNTRNENYVKHSGLVIDSIDGGRLHIVSWNPLAVASQYHRLPKFLLNKKAIVNVQNQDNRCFGYAILSALYHATLPADERGCRPTAYTEEQFALHNLDKLRYPIAPDQVPEIEREIGIGINVFSYYDDEGKARYPVFISRLHEEQEQAEHEVIDLLYFNDHWAWIRNFSRFMHDQDKHKAAHFWCKRCVSRFWRKEDLEQHSMYCERPDFVSTVCYYIQCVKIL